MLAIFRYLLSSAVMSHRTSTAVPARPPAGPACLSAAALSARFRANFSARILPLGSTLAWRYTLFLEIWFVSWLTVSFLLAAAISQRIPPRCAARKRLACPFFRTNSPLLTLILFGTPSQHLNWYYILKSPSMTVRKTQNKTWQLWLYVIHPIPSLWNLTTGSKTWQLQQ